MAEPKQKLYKILIQLGFLQNELLEWFNVIQHQCHVYNYEAYIILPAFT